MTDEQKLKLARAALRAVLQRIRENEEVRYHLGPGTSTFEKVTGAYAGITSIPHDKIMNETVPGSSSITHSTPEELLEELL